MKSTWELGEQIASLSAHLDAATHHLLECIRGFDAAAGWHEQGAISCTHWLTWRVGWDPCTAREWLRVARALGRLPAIDEALRTGSLSYAKVRALTRVATAETEGKLLKLALFATGAQLERLCRGYRSVLEREEVASPEERSVRRRQLPGGMVKLELVLQPDEADLILRAVDRAREVHAAEQAEHPEQAELPPPGEAARPPPCPGAFRGNVLAVTSGRRGDDRRVVPGRPCGEGNRWGALPGHGSSGSGRAGPRRRLDRYAGGWHARFRGSASEGSLRLRPGGGRSRRKSGWGGAEHRPPYPKHSAGHPTSVDAA